jgi:hypothetical protein
MNRAVLVFPLIIFSLLIAVWSGWLRIGWSLPVGAVAAQHGNFMVNSFLASLIFLERAVTFKSKWILLLPAITALSGIAFICGFNLTGQLLLTAGSAGFALMCSYFVYRYSELYYYAFLVGSICLLTGNIILLKTHYYPGAVNWWIGFLLFTIVAERLELSRFLSLNNFKRNFLLVSLAGALAALVWPFQSNGNLALAIPIAMTAFWLLKYDMAKHSIKMKGQHRYSGLLLITGYVWLLIMAVLLVTQAYIPFGYDAVLHSFFIGFVFSMIFSHAPIILPAVARLPIKIYRPFLFVLFILLQASLIIRIMADVIGDAWCRKIGGLTNGIAILLFFISIAFIVMQELRPRRSGKA